MRRLRSDGRHGVLLACALMAGCAAVGVEDVPPAAAAAANVAVARDFPGAARVLQGFELAGERSLRHGDRVLYGVEVARGNAVTRNLLQIEVVRPPLPGVRHVLGFTNAGELHVTDRVARMVALEFTLFDAEGKELQRSRAAADGAGEVSVTMLDCLPDFFLEQSFIDGIVGAGQALDPAMLLSTLRLVHVVNLLNSDPILKRLLAEVAPIPFDLRLLFRREATLVPYFERGSPVASTAGDLLGGAFPKRYELPFDLLLNDSVFVRLSATVVDPHGPTGAVGGIVLLRAQQAKDVTRQVRLQLLACARGAASEWQRSGMLATCGAIDEGVALAFSPDGRWVAMPGELGVVELRDLQSPDPTSTRSLCGRRATVHDLAFLDATTLLVARGSSVESFDLTAVSAIDGKIAAVATVATPINVAAIELAPQRTCFVGLGDGAVQRWSFGETLGVPQIEPICDGDKSGRQMAFDDEPFELMPPLGFLVSGDERDRIVVGQGLLVGGDSRGWTTAGTASKDVEFVRDAAGVWQKRDLPPLPPDATQRERWRGASGVVHGKDGVQKGGGFSGPLRGEFKLSAGDTVTLLGGPQGSRNLGRGHPNPGQIVHGFDPSGRFAAFVSPGYRLLIDCERANALP